MIKMLITESRFWGIHVFFPPTSVKREIFMTKLKESIPLLRSREESTPTLELYLGLNLSSYYLCDLRQVT